MAAVQEGHSAADSRESSVQVNGAGVGFSDAQGCGFGFASLCFRKQSKKTHKTRTVSYGQGASTVFCFSIKC